MEQAQYTTKQILHKCGDIGMGAIDRSREHSCVHASPYCQQHCYNNKFGWPNVKGKDLKNDLHWPAMTGDSIRQALKGLRAYSTDRLRLCTRGEPFASRADVALIKRVLSDVPEVLFWIPTRAWRNKALRELIREEIAPIPNARVQASIDPSNSWAEIYHLHCEGWSTMFFAKDTDGGSVMHPLGDLAIKCIKTWEHQIGACRTCDVCFGERQTHTWLLDHE